MIRTLIAEHVHVVRMGLVALLSREADIDVVAEIEKGDRIDVVASVRRPQVAVIDVDLPPEGGAEGAGRLRTHLPSCAIVLLVERGDLGGLCRAQEVRPLGLLSKEAPSELLTRCVRRVAAGRRVVDPELAGASGLIAANPLTPRELEVLRIAAGGATTAEIARRLSLSAKTVRNHLSSAIVRIGARNRVDAIRIAVEHEWL